MMVENHFRAVHIKLRAVSEIGGPPFQCLTETTFMKYLNVVEHVTDLDVCSEEDLFPEMVLFVRLCMS